jgi:heme a synthase
MDTSAVDLVDWAPVARLMLLGVAIALGPLLWVWLRHRGAAPVQRLRALTWVTLFLTFDLIIVGAFTRLTDSGLGCPDWPGCYGAASPLGARAEISAAQQAMPTGPVTHTKAWIEMVHRYMATGVGVLIITLLVTSAALRRTGSLPMSLAWPVSTLIWVCVQGAFGALTVTMKLFPAIVTLHLLGAMVLLALLVVQGVRYVQAHTPQQGTTLPQLSFGLQAALLSTLSLVMVQIALGGWVSTNYAVLACRDFPTCQGQWWPPMNFSEGFQVWRELGQLRDGSNISFAALTAIHMVHRLGALVVLLALVATGLALLKQGHWRRAGFALLLLAAWQLVSGLSNVVLGWPIVAALAHTAGAAALVGVLTWSLAWAWAPSGRSFRSAAKSRLPQADDASSLGVPGVRA